MLGSYDIGRELLKWLAIITMTMDHVGAVLFQEITIFRCIGRLAFPIFAYLLILGLESTRNVKNYLLRLLLFALISQAPFSLAFEVPPWEHLNIFFTLSSGVIFIYFFEKNNYLFILPLAASVVLPFDFSIYGLLVIGCFYLLRRNRNLGAISFFLLNLMFLFVWPVQLLSIFALPIIILYNNGWFSFKKLAGKVDYSFWRKYFFYLYYPLHLLLLFFMK